MLLLMCIILLHIKHYSTHVHVYIICISLSVKIQRNTTYVDMSLHDITCIYICTYKDNHVRT